MSDQDLIAWAQKLAVHAVDESREAARMRDTLASLADALVGACARVAELEGERDRFRSSMLSASASAEWRANERTALLAQVAELEARLEPDAFTVAIKSPDESSPTGFRYSPDGTYWSLRERAVEYLAHCHRRVHLAGTWPTTREYVFVEIREVEIDA